MSNEDRARAFDACHPDRRQVFDRFAFARNLEGSTDENEETKKKSIVSPVKTMKPSVKIQEVTPIQSSIESVLLRFSTRIIY